MPRVIKEPSHIFNHWLGLSFVTCCNSCSRYWWMFSFFRMSCLLPLGIPSSKVQCLSYFLRVAGYLAMVFSPCSLEMLRWPECGRSAAQPLSWNLLNFPTMVCIAGLPSGWHLLDSSATPVLDQPSFPHRRIFDICYCKFNSIVHRSLKERNNACN